MAGAIPEAALPVTVEEHNETDTYATKADLEGIVERVFEKLAPRIEETVKRAIENASQETDKKIAAVKGEIRGEFNAQLSTHIKQESEQRQRDIEAVRLQLKEAGNETHKKLGEFTALVESATKTVNSAMHTVEVLNTKIEGWNNSLSSNRQLYEENRRHIERMEGDSAIVVKEQATISEKVTALHRTIHGGEGEDTPSIFSELKRAWEYNQTQNSQITAALARLDKMEKERLEEQERQKKAEQEKKARSANRVKAVKSLAKEAAKTPYFWVIAALAILSVVGIFSPETLPQLISFAQSFLSATP